MGGSWVVVDNDFFGNNLAGWWWQSRLVVVVVVFFESWNNAFGRQVLSKGIPRFFLVGVVLEMPFQGILVAVAAAIVCRQVSPPGRIKAQQQLPYPSFGRGEAHHGLSQFLGFDPYIQLRCAIGRRRRRRQVVCRWVLRLLHLIVAGRIEIGQEGCLTHAHVLQLLRQGCSQTFHFQTKQLQFVGPGHFFKTKIVDTNLGQYLLLLRRTIAVGGDWW